MVKSEAPAARCNSGQASAPAPVRRWSNTTNRSPASSARSRVFTGSGTEVQLPTASRKKHQVAAWRRAAARDPNRQRQRSANLAGVGERHSQR
jgi:hypothetical protein